METGTDAAHIRSMIRDLRTPDRYVVLLWYADELTSEEISEAVGLSVHDVEHILSQFRQTVSDYRQTCADNRRRVEEAVQRSVALSADDDPDLADRIRLTRQLAGRLVRKIADVMV